MSAFFKTATGAILLFGAVFLSALAALSNPARAHSLNESYVYFQLADETMTGRVEINTWDLARVFDLENPEIWDRQEVLDRAQEVFDHFDGRLILQADGVVHPVRFTEASFLNETLGDGSEMAQFEFDVPTLMAAPDTIEMSYDFLFSDIDPTHRGFALIESNTRTGVLRNESYILLVFRPGDGMKTLYLNGQPKIDVFIGFLVVGIWHILLGLDHLLFLGALLLTSVMVRSGGRWDVAPDPRRSVRRIIILLTVFTLAHSVTLALSAFHIFNLPKVQVDALIAASIGLIALSNIFPKLNMTSWPAILVFGLVHGLGFARFFAPLGSDPARRAVGLTGYNVGIELGQIAVVVVVFPILFLLRKKAFYRPLALYAGSVFLIAFALFWFVERTYNILGPVRKMVLG